MKFVDTNGAEIAPAKTSTGIVGDQYMISQDVIPGYIFKEVKDNASTSGQYADTDTTITLVYEQVKNTGTITTKFTDESGAEIAPAKTATGSVGDKFTASPATIV